MAIDVQKIMEQKLKEREQKQNSLMSANSPYAPLLAKVEQFNKAHGYGSLTENMKRNIAQCCENAVIDAQASRGKIFETTYQSNIAFLGIQLPVISALLTSLALNEVSIVQALDRRSGSVFYMDIKAGQNKGAVVSGDSLIAAKTGHASSNDAMEYGMSLVEAENLTNAQVCNGTLNYQPIIAGSVIITDGVHTFTDNGLNVMVADSSLIANGTIDYTLGTYAVNFGTTPAARPVASYTIDWERNTTEGVPEVDVNLTSETITALDFKLRSKYTMSAAMDLEKAHGINLDSEVVKFLGGEIKMEIDRYGLKLINAAAGGANAATSPGAWSAAVGSGEAWVWKKFELGKFFIKGSNNILVKTKRGQATYIIAGVNVAGVIEDSAPRFKATNVADVQTGPHKIGTYDGLTVIKDPFMDANTYTLGFKGDSYLYAGFMLAPYIPLFTTPTLITSDLVAQKGFYSANSYKVLNPGLFTKGTISGF